MIDGDKRREYHQSFEVGDIVRLRNLIEIEELYNERIISKGEMEYYKRRYKKRRKNFNQNVWKITYKNTQKTAIRNHEDDNNKQLRVDTFRIKHTGFNNIIKTNKSNLRGW